LRDRRETLAHNPLRDSSLTPALHLRVVSCFRARPGDDARAPHHVLNLGSRGSVHLDRNEGWYSLTVNKYLALLETNEIDKIRRWTAFDSFGLFVGVIGLAADVVTLSIFAHTTGSPKWPAHFLVLALLGLIAILYSLMLIAFYVQRALALKLRREGFAKDDEFRRRIRKSASAVTYGIGVPALSVFFMCWIPSHLALDPFLNSHDQGAVERWQQLLGLVIADAVCAIILAVALTEFCLLISSAIHRGIDPEYKQYDL
jgi:MFS family permease